MKTQMITKEGETYFWHQQVGTVDLKGKDSVALVKEARRKLELEERE